MLKWVGDKLSPDRATAQGQSWQADDPVHPRIVSTLTLSTELPEGADFYAGGRIVRGSTILEIESNTTTTITVRHPNGSTPLTQTQKDVFLGGQFEVFDDDDTGLPESPLPKSNLINDEVKKKYIPAYIEIEEVDANLNPNRTIPFNSNSSVFDSSTGLDDAQDMAGADRTDYWYHMLVVAYQPDTTRDCDPVIGENLLLGVTGVAYYFFGLEGLGIKIWSINEHFSILYVEAVREDESGHRAEPDFQQRIQKRIEKVTAHEIAHPPGGLGATSDHDEGGLMGDGADGGDEFTPATLNRFRKTLPWNP